MATFNITAFDGEKGKIRSGVFFPELLINDWDGEKNEPIGAPMAKTGILVGAQRRPLILPDRKILIPANRGQVAWSGESSPITKLVDFDQEGGGTQTVSFAVSGSIQTIKTEAKGTRFAIVAPAEGEQAATTLVSTGLKGNRAQQESALLALYDQNKRTFPHGSYAMDDGARGLVRKIRTALTRTGGTLTRVNHLIEVQVGGRVLVAGMLAEEAVWLLANEGHGRLKIVEQGKHLRPKFAELAHKRRAEKPDADKQDETPADTEMAAA